MKKLFLIVCMLCIQISAFASESIVNRIGKVSGLNNIEVRWNDDAMYYNAETHPYEKDARTHPYIILSTYMKNLLNEDEQALVISHEIAHLTGKQREIREHETTYYPQNDDYMVLDMLISLHNEMMADRTAVLYMKQAGFDLNACETYRDKMAFRTSFIGKELPYAETIGYWAFPNFTGKYLPYGARRIMFEKNIEELNTGNYPIQDNLTVSKDKFSTVGLKERTIEELLKEFDMLVAYEKEYTPIFFRIVDSLSDKDCEMVMLGLQKGRIRQFDNLRKYINISNDMASVLDRMTEKTKQIYIERANYVAKRAKSVPYGMMGTSFADVRRW